jgi:transcriptional regulator with XRE-family HTH domain
MEPSRRGASQAHLEAFGLRVRVLRVKRGLSQEELGHAAGLGRTVVGYIERAERDVGISHVWPLAEALGVPAAALFEPES